MPCFAKRGPVQKPGETQVITKKLRKKARDRGDDGHRRYRPDKKEKPRTVKRSIGGEALENCRFGPEVIIDFLECTPLPLWNCTDLEIDYSSVTEKTSTEIIQLNTEGVTKEKESDEKEDEEEEDVEEETEGYRKSGQEESFQRSNPMDWDPNLTELEEDESAAAEILKPEHFKLAYSLPLENDSAVYEKAVETVQILKPDGTLELRDRVKVVIKETKTELLIQVKGHAMLEEGLGGEEMKMKNEKYDKMRRDHVELDNYTEGGTQTFVDAERNKYTQLVGVGALDKTQLVNEFIMFDDYIELKEQQRLRLAKEEEEAIIKSLAEGTQEKESESLFQDSSSDEESEAEDKQQAQSQVEWNKIDEYFDLDEDLDPPDDINDLDQDLVVPSDEELDVALGIDEIYSKRVQKALKSRPKLLPDISYSVLVLQRLASTNKHHRKHVEIRGLDPMFRKELTRRQIYQMRNDLLVEAGPTLKRFWAYKPNLTKGLEVTSISVHPTNGNIMAASYGSNAYPSPTAGGGLVLVWSLKNINTPERIYRFDISATIVVFSNLTPFLLAIGLLDGNIYIYDIRSFEPRVYCSTEKMVDKPIGPIWDLYWLQETEMASTGTVREVLISVSDDGYLYRWTSAKGFEPWILLKVRRSPLKIPGRREKRAEALISQWSATYTVCFYPNDLTTYLIGTEEGFIHKCTTSYTEQFLTTYVSHTGPVYAIRFNPFAKDIFISCGGDWSVKIWKEDYPAAPLLTLSTGLNTVFDVAWAPDLPSVFVCTNELELEVWDVTVNTLEPVAQFKFPNLGLRRVSFYRYVQGLLVGDSDGGVTVYALRNFPEPPESLEGKIDYLLLGLIPGYKRQVTDVKPVEEEEEYDWEEEESEEEEEEEYDLEGMLQTSPPSDLAPPGP